MFRARARSASAHAGTPRPPPLAATLADGVAEPRVGVGAAASPGARILTVVLGSLCASFLNAASNALNQIYDLEIDRVNKPNRPLVTGALSWLRHAFRFTRFVIA